MITPTVHFIEDVKPKTRLIQEDSKRSKSLALVERVVVLLLSREAGEAAGEPQHSFATVLS